MGVKKCIFWPGFLGVFIDDIGIFDDDRGKNQKSDHCTFVSFFYQNACGVGRLDVAQ